MDILVFTLDDQLYGLPTAAVMELIRAVAIVPLPKSSGPIEGVINMRGRIVPVLDVRSLFQLAPKALSPADIFIVASAHGQTVALRVEAVVDLTAAAARDILPADKVGHGVRYLSGMLQWRDKIVLIHDLSSYVVPSETAALAASAAHFARVEGAA